MSLQELMQILQGNPQLLMELVKALAQAGIVGPPQQGAPQGPPQGRPQGPPQGQMMGMRP